MKNSINQILIKKNKMMQNSHASGEEKRTETDEIFGSLEQKERELPVFKWTIMWLRS